MTYAKLGRPEVARRLTREAETSVPETIRRGEPGFWFAAGALAEAEGVRTDARRPTATGTSRPALYGVRTVRPGPAGGCGGPARLGDRAV